MKIKIKDVMLGVGIANDRKRQIRVLYKNGSGDGDESVHYHGFDMLSGRWDGVNGRITVRSMARWADRLATPEEMQRLEKM